MCIVQRHHVSWTLLRVNFVQFRERWKIPFTDGCYFYLALLANSKSLAELNKCFVVFFFLCVPKLPLKCCSWYSLLSSYFKYLFFSFSFLFLICIQSPFCLFLFSLLVCFYFTTLDFQFSIPYSHASINYIGLQIKKKKTTSEIWCIIGIPGILPVISSYSSKSRLRYFLSEVWI